MLCCVICYVPGTGLNSVHTLIYLILTTTPELGPIIVTFSTWLTKLRQRGVNYLSKVELRFELRQFGPESVN